MKNLKFFFVFVKKILLIKMLFCQDRIRFTVIENRVALTADDNMDPVISVPWTTAADGNGLRVKIPKTILIPARPPSPLPK